MKINFFRGDYHEVKFRFPKFSGKIDNIYLTVKCNNRVRRLQKKLGDGIELKGEWYVVTFEPSDTHKLSCDINMIYDIEIIVDGKPYTVTKNEFKLEEDITTPVDEV